MCFVLVSLSRTEPVEIFSAALDLSFHVLYHGAKRMNLSEVSGHGAIRDFVLAVDTVDSIYGNSRQEARNTIKDQKHRLWSRREAPPTHHGRGDREVPQPPLTPEQLLQQSNTPAQYSQQMPEITSKDEDQQGKRAKDRDKSKRTDEIPLFAFVERRCGMRIVLTLCLARH